MARKEVNLTISLEELLIISNSLNEVCNGLPLDDFENRIGLPHELVLKLLKKVSQLYRVESAD